MNFDNEKETSNEVAECEEFVPISEFYARKPKPKPAQTKREQQVEFSVIERGPGKFNAVIYIGDKVLDPLRWKITDKVAVFIDNKLHKIRISPAVEGQKPAYTLVRSKAKRNQVAKFSFILAEGMGIQMGKARVHTVPHELKNVSAITVGDLIIDLSGVAGEPTEAAETSIPFEEVEA